MIQNTGPGSFYNGPLSNPYEKGNISAGSIYSDVNAPIDSIVALENNSFVDIQGSFSDIPGVTKTPRQSRSLRSVGGVIVTIIETLAPTPVASINAVIKCAGRFLGFIPPFISYGVVETAFVGEPIHTSAQFISEWEVEVDDNLISQTLSSTGKIYALVCSDVSGILLNTTLGPGAGIYSSVDAISSFGGFFANMMAIDITSLAGSTATVGTAVSGGPISDFASLPYNANAVYGMDLSFVCSINSPPWDLIGGTP